LSGASPFDAATRAAMRSDRVAVIDLVRHGAVRELEQRVVRGQLDTGLSEVGRAEERAVVEQLARRVPDRIVASDLKRCAGAAQALGVRLECAVELEPLLREQSLGRWEGRTWEALQMEDGDGASAYWRDFVHTVPPGGESFAQMAIRVLAWLGREREALLDRTTAVITHAGPIRVLVAHALGLGLENALRLAPPTGSRSRVLFSEAGGVLETFGERTP